MAVRALTAALAMWGLLAAAAAATAEQPPQDNGVRMLLAPDVPINVQAFCDINTMGDSLPLMRVQWQPPASGPAPLAYKVYVDDKLIDTVNANSWMETKLTHLKVGIQYKLSVSAVNADGESPLVDVYQTAVVLPDPPRNVQAVPGDGWIDVYWDPPLDTGGAPIGKYFVNGFIRFLNISETQCDSTGPTSCRMPNVTNNEVYDIMVFGESSVPHMMMNGARSVQAMATGLPSGPRRFRVVSGGGTTITLAWDAPLEPGPDPILGYEISWIGYLHPMDPGNYYNSFQNPWSVVVPASARQFQVTDLTPGYNWQFVIQAFTATRIGSMTTGPLYIHEPNYQTLGLPGKPSRVGILGMGSGAVKLAWEAPDPDGNAAIKLYRITLTPVGGNIVKKRERRPIVVECTADGPDPQCDGEYIVSGLKNGIQYSVTIAAKNRFGFGPESIDSVMVLTEPPPGEPAAKAVWKPPKRSARDLVERLQKLSEGEADGSL